MINAATTLSTATDGLSVKVDTLISAADTLVNALQGVDLPPAAQDAVAKMKEAADIAAKAGVKADNEVAKLDSQLPTPAPAGT